MNKALTALLAIGLVAGLSALLMSEPAARVARRLDEPVTGAGEPLGTPRPDAGVAVAPAVLVGGGRDQLAVKALQILTTYCARCHAGRGEGQAAGGLDYLLDRDALVAHKRIALGEPARSPLLAKMERHEQPPRGEQPRPTGDEIALFATWITQGAPVPEVGSGKGQPIAFVSTTEMERAVFDDLESLAGEERESARYFTLAHLYNRAAPGSEQQQTRAALARLLGALAAKGTTIAPLPIDLAATLVRVDLRQLGWSARTWNRIAAAYPFAVSRDTLRARAIQDATGCAVPLLRADWFVHAASRPPLSLELGGAPDAASPAHDGGALEDALAEPSIVEVARRYESDLDVRAAAAELGLLELELAPRPAKSRPLPPAIARLVDGKAALSREAFVAEFAAAAAAFGLGTQIVKLPAAPRLPTLPPVADGGSP